MELHMHLKLNRTHLGNRRTSEHEQSRVRKVRWRNAKDSYCLQDEATEAVEAISGETREAQG